ncbi:MAG TPA: hypothetical protein VMU15_11915 [Anaeromyxobacter sp.]|nr:hypothetical protein [Anaeromyxobacter sp.]
MTLAAAAFLPALLGATFEVPAGADLGAALAAAQPGDEIRLGPGAHAGSLGRVRGPLSISGAGAGSTSLVAPEGEDGLVVEGGTVRLSGLSLRSGPRRAALKVLAGEVLAEDLAATGGAVGVFVESGSFSAREVDLSGDYGLLLHGGSVSVTGGAARGVRAAIAQLHGESVLSRLAVSGPSIEAGVTISGGTASLEDLVIRSPGPAGLSVLGTARVDARRLDISGAVEEDGGILGDCVQVRRGALRLEASTLTRCGGAAVEVLGGEVEVRAVDAVGGEAGCLVFLEKSRAELQGDRCTGHGPALVAASSSQVHASMDHWLADPVLWVECGSGARVHLGVGEAVREPCRDGVDRLDKTTRP